MDTSGLHHPHSKATSKRKKDQTELTKAELSLWSELGGIANLRDEE